MKRILTVAAALAFLAGGSHAIAQTTSHSEKVIKQEGPGPDTKTKIETVTGIVKEYEPGKKIKIVGPSDKDYSFDLDENAKVEGAIGVGQKATVRFTKGDDGKEHVLVLSHAAEGHGAYAIHQPKTHMERTTKREGPGPNIKTKTEIVIGTVKEYEAGKKIKLIGPSDKLYTFDLDEQVARKGTIAPGQMVKVEYTKQDDGTERVVILSQWSEPAPSKKKM